MKKFLCIIFVLTLCCMFFTGCESQEEKQANIDAMIIAIVNGDSEINLKYHGDQYVLDTAGEMYSILYEEENYDAIERMDDAIATLFSKTDFDQDNARAMKTAKKTENLKRIFSSGDAGEFIRFIEYCYNGNSAVDFLYRDNAEKDLKLFLDKTASKPKIEDGEGGYYDDKKDLYISETSKYYDPLSKRYVSHGELGTYRKYTSYRFHGDFLVKSSGKMWYGNYSGGPSPDTTYYTTYFKDELEIKGNSETNSGYGVESEEGINLDYDIYYVEEERALIELGSWSMKIFTEDTFYDFYI